jgi:hypothetical protein
VCIYIYILIAVEKKLIREKKSGGRQRVVRYCSRNHRTKENERLGKNNNTTEEKTTTKTKKKDVTPEKMNFCAGHDLVRSLATITIHFHGQKAGF